jgi:membrane protease YdiL (CAAX protease family)
MSLETGELTRLLFLALSGLILVMGVTVDFCLVFLMQTRRLTPSLSAKAHVGGGPFSAFHVQLALVATLFFALIAALQTPSDTPPQDTALVTGILLYAATAFLAVCFGLFYSRVTFRQAFLAPRISAWNAAKKGLLYGVAAIPPVVGLSIGMTAALEGLGYPPQPQEMFEWLADDALAAGTRLFTMAAAVLIAPVVEELLFRGILFAAVLKTRTFAFAALLSGVYFALVHLHAPSFLPLLALSTAFSAGYAATGSIVTPIVMHALFNLTSLLFYLAAPL